jgi:hypothetical protein
MYMVLRIEVGSLPRRVSGTANTQYRRRRQDHAKATDLCAIANAQIDAGRDE